MKKHTVVIVLLLVCICLQTSIVLENLDWMLSSPIKGAFTESVSQTKVALPDDYLPNGVSSTFAKLMAVALLGMAPLVLIYQKVIAQFESKNITMLSTLLLIVVGALHMEMSLYIVESMDYMRIQNMRSETFIIQQVIHESFDKPRKEHCHTRLQWVLDTLEPSKVIHFQCANFDTGSLAKEFAAGDTVKVKSGEDVHGNKVVLEFSKANP